MESITNKKGSKRQAGFTLPELVMVVSIVGILVAMALPSMRSSVSKSDITALSNDLVSSLRFARLEAVKRISRTTIQAKGGENNASWVNGFTVSQAIDVGGTVQNTDLKVTDPLRPNITVSSTTGSMEIAFDSRGFADQNHSIEFCDTNDSSIEGRRVVVEASGYAFSEVLDCSS